MKSRKFSLNLYAILQEMTNVYTNKILFGHSNNQITSEYLEKMEPYMLTEQWLSTNASVQLPPLTKGSSEPSSVGSSEPLPVAPQPKIERIRDLPKPDLRQVSAPRHREQPGNTLFWAIHSFVHPKEAFLRPSAANVEIETRVQIVNSMRNTPKRLKATNSKMTIEATQGLLGSMLTAREDRIEFCVAYSVYYGKHIIIVYPNSCRVFSPTVETEIEDDDHVIILHAKKTQKVVYSAEPNPTKEMAENILRTKPTILKAQSNYKMPDLESIAAKFGIPTKTPESKRRKKEDVYNDVRLALHNDMNFARTP